jgi:hypothetical protein
MGTNATSRETSRKADTAIGKNPPIQLGGASLEMRRTEARVRKKPPSEPGG